MVKLKSIKDKWFQIKSKIISGTTSALHFLKEWSNSIIAIAAIISIFYTHYATKKSYRLVTRTIELTKEQLYLQKQSIPIQFTVTYKDQGTYQEQVFITNTGKTLLKKLHTEYKYYYILPDYLTLTRYGILSKLKTDTLLFNKFRQIDIIYKANDLTNLFEPSRNFFLLELPVFDTTQLEISSSSIQNALKIASVLNAQLVTRWSIRYVEELDNKEMISSKYIWMHKSNLDRSPMGRKNMQREDLTTVIGGQRVIDVIEDFEKNSKEVIFGYD